MGIENSTKNQTSTGLQPGFPFPKKMALSIEGVLTGAHEEDLPIELKRFLKKAHENLGPDATEDIVQIYSCLLKHSNPQNKATTLKEKLLNLTKIQGVILRDNPTFSATVPIVWESSNLQKVEQIGSGVLVRIINRTFLLTAAHVTDWQSEGTLMIPGKKGFIPIEGSFCNTRIPVSGCRDVDKYDVAYFWLDSACVNDLHSDCAILERQDVSLDAEPLQRTDYSVAGYPCRKSCSKEGIVGTEFTTMSGFEAQKSDYEVLSRTRDHHILIRFNRKRAFSQSLGSVITAPLPEGMSGGGVYAWSKEAVKTWPVRLPLVGIVNGFFRDRSLLIATRLHVYVDVIFHNQPELAAIASPHGIVNK